MANNTTTNYSAIMADFQRRQDYIGAANFLSTFRGKDKYAQEELDYKIKSLKQKQRVYDSMMARADNSQKQAIAFALATRDNTAMYPDPNKNIYSQKYINARNLIGGEDATSLQINFDNPTFDIIDDGANILANTLGGAAVGGTAGFGVAAVGALPGAIIGGIVGLGKGIYDYFASPNASEKIQDNYKNFMAVTGYNDEALRAQGIKVSRENGRVTLQIHKNNLNFDKFANALNKYNQTGNSWGIDGVDSNGNLVIQSETQTSPGGLPVSVGDNTKSQFINMFNVYKEANDVLDQFTANNDNNQISVGTTVLPYSSVSALNAWMHGDDALYKQYVERDKRALDFASLGRYDVWVSDINENGKEELRKVTDPNMLLEYQNMVTSALANKGDEGGWDNIDVGVAISGDMTGAYITLPVDKRKIKTGLEYIDSAISGKEHTNRVSLFIPGLLSDEADKIFNASSKTQAMKELAKMGAYGYDYDLKNGNKLITNVGLNGDVSYSLYNNVNKTTTPLQGNDDALNLLNKEFIIDDAVTAAKQMQYLPDGSIASNLNQKEIYNGINNVADNAIAEMYPQYFETYFKLRKAEKEKKKVDATNLEREIYVQLVKERNEIAGTILQELGLIP